MKCFLFFALIFFQNILISQTFSFSKSETLDRINSKGIKIKHLKQSDFLFSIDISDDFGNAEVLFKCDKEKVVKILFKCIPNTSVIIRFKNIFSKVSRLEQKQMREKYGENMPYNILYLEKTNYFDSFAKYYYEINDNIGLLYIIPQ